MKEKHLKNLIYSLIIINSWTLYCLFDSYEDSVFRGFLLYKYFLKSIAVAIFFGILIIVLRLILHYLVNFKNKLKNTFLYTFLAVFNLWLFAIWLILIFMKITLFIFLSYFEIFILISPFLISLFLFIDLYIYKKLEL
jgi:hypothetical protein